MEHCFPKSVPSSSKNVSEGLEEIFEKDKIRIDVMSDSDIIELKHLVNE